MSDYPDYITNNILDVIYRTTCIELPGTSFSDVDDIINGKEAGKPFPLVLTVKGIQEAWNYLLGNLHCPPSIELAQKYNFFLTEELMLGAGKIRDTGVYIRGSRYKPPMPSKESITAVVKNIEKEPDPQRRGMKWFAQTAKSQWFGDGNKRTAAMLANHSLMRDDCGLFLLQETSLDVMRVFFDNLRSYYEGNDEESFVEWLLDHMLVELP